MASCSHFACIPPPPPPFRSICYIKKNSVVCHFGCPKTTFVGIFLDISDQYATFEAAITIISLNIIHSMMQHNAL